MSETNGQEKFEGPQSELTASDLSVEQKERLATHEGRRRSDAVQNTTQSTLFTFEELERAFPNLAKLVSAMPEGVAQQEQILAIQRALLKNEEQPDLGDGSKRLASQVFPKELLTITFYAPDELVELDRRIGLLLEQTSENFQTLMVDAQSALVVRQTEIEEIKKKERLHSVNGTNVDHILDWLHDNQLDDRIPAVVAEAESPSEEKLREERAFTLQRYGRIVDAYWLAVGTPTAVYDLGLSIQRYGYGAGWRAAQMGKAGYSPAVGFDLFESQVEAFNSNKGFKKRKRDADKHLYGCYGPIPANHEEHVIDMFNFDHVETNEDIQSRLYIQGIFESVLLGYGLDGGDIEPQILEQPIDVLIDYLDRMSVRGIPGIPKLGKCRIETEPGENYGKLFIGDDEYGYAVQERENWHELDDWYTPPLEKRQKNLLSGQCLIKLTRDLELPRPLDKNGKQRPPVKVLTTGGFVALHRLPTSRFRIVNRHVSKLKHLPVATANQLVLLGKDAFRAVGQLDQMIRTHGLLSGLSQAFRSSVDLKRLNWEAMAKARQEEMMADGHRWVDERSAALEGQFETLLHSAQLLQRVIEQGDIPDAQLLEVLKNISALLGDFHEETALHVERVTTVSSELAQRLLTNPYVLYRYDETVNDPEFLTDLRYAAELHDLGKLGVPSDVVLCPGKFTKRQVILMQSHALYSDLILKLLGQRSKRFARIGPIAGAHHEKYDGSGYPYGLKGDTIPFGAQILAVADVGDALGILGEKRDYQKTVKPRPVILRIFANDTRDRQFNPLAVAALFEYADDMRRLNPEEVVYYKQVQEMIREQFPDAA